ncbi:MULTISPECIES: YbaB/EbfC family nucleoid-associated protein [Clostridiaceae]|uniref:Nucleoid-associated protein H8Z77_03220 n=1 Tax=Clostridium facile TaxID=2763035 RepID=A0ABR7IPG4_9CLOT|nr:MULTISPECIES: YbaB/EbfC family nucleoid-associated protein [Clostridiaceae]MBC5787035.1 YbaB/EbfC family nucleoid-associated protein [Clostridium facile]
MKSRLPKGYGGGVNDMVKRAQEMQAKMEQAQAELEAMEFTSSVGGGVVEAVVSGKKEVTALHIKPEVVDPDDVEMLQDLIISAINEAMAQVEAKSEEDMQKITGGISIPGLM